MMIYGVTQLDHGHEHRWLFTEEEVAIQFQKYGLVLTDDQVDLWPIGGSHSEPSYLQELCSDEDIKEFLTAPGEGPNSTDPMLAEIAEYYVTVDTDEGSCTQEYLDKFGFDAEKLTQSDDKYQHYAECVKMIAALKEINFEDLDYTNPYYGSSYDMRYSTLCTAYKSLCCGEAPKL